MILIKTTYHGAAVPGILPREMPRILKAAYEAAGIDWHARARPKHFTRAGAREYNYTPRKGEAGNPHPRGFQRSYTGRKLRRFGHTLPLVYTGESLALTRLRDVRATARGVRVVIRAPKLNLRPKSGTINMRLELVTINDADRRHAEETIDQAAQAGINALQATKTTTA